jgi:DUF4097 and DUF4098 domain-containing protein YvlB
MAEQRFATPGPVRLQVKIPMGNVDVATVESAESTVSIEGSEKLVDTVKVELNRDRLVVEQQRKAFIGFFGRFEGSLHVRACVPHHAQVEIVTASGDARLDGIFAALETKSASGDISVNGDVEGNARASSVSGDVHFPGVMGDLTIRSVSGDVTAESVGGSASLKSVSGNVRVGSVREGHVTVQSVSGDVEIGIAPGAMIDVDVKSASGEVSSEFPLSAAPGDSVGPTVVLRGNTVSGDFRVFRASLADVEAP